MVASALLEPIALLLFFFLPGFFLARALWPDWRFHGVKALERGLTTVVAAVVLSLVLTILVGFILGNVGAFQAGPSDPILEGVLAVLTAVFVAAAGMQGAFSKVPPAPSRWVTEPLHGEEDAEEFTARMEAMGREERRLRHDIRVGRKESPGTADRLQRELEALLEERHRIEQEREELLAS